MEEKLTAVLAAAGGGLTRVALFDRLDDVFETEGDLAKALGPMVADGRLLRSSRPRPGKADEFVYTVAKNEHTAAIATAPKSTPAAARERKHSGELAAAVLAALRGASEPLKSAAIAEVLQVHVSNVVTALAKLEARGDAERQGAGRSTLWQAARRVTPPPEPKLEPPAEPTPAPEPEPLRTLPAPVAAAEACSEPRCAIEDTGLFAINDGKATIRLTPKAIHKVVGFLELTQHVWKGRP